jgi:MFS family permease
MGTVGVAVLVAAYPASVPVVSLGCIVLTPRFGARPIALASTLLMTAATIIFAFAPNAVVLDCARFLQGFASGTIWTSSMAWVTQNAPEGRRGRESGIVMGFLSAGSIAGPGVGALAAAAGLRSAFVLVGLVSAASAVLTALAPAGLGVPAEARLIGSIRRSLAQPLAQAAVAVALIDPFAFAAVDVLVPLHLGRLGTPTVAIAVAFAVGAALGAVAAPLAGRIVDRIGAAPVALTSAAAVAASPLIFAASPGERPALLALIACSVIFAFVGSAIFPLSSAGADLAGVGHVVVNGVLGAIWAVGFTAAPLIAGGLADLAGETVAFCTATCLCLPALALMVRGVRRSRVVPYPRPGG